MGWIYYYCIIGICGTQFEGRDDEEEIDGYFVRHPEWILNDYDISFPEGEGLMADFDLKDTYVTVVKKKKKKKNKRKEERVMRMNIFSRLIRIKFQKKEQKN